MLKRPAISGETFEGRLNEDPKISVIKVELDRHNYKKKFYNLISFEERGHIKVLHDKYVLVHVEIIF